MSNIEHMVNRFLAWKLPADFSPDAGIGFKPYHPQQTPDNPMWPTGTNLLTAEQARGMFEYVLEGAQQPRQRPKLTPEDIAAEDAAGGVFAAGALVAQQPRQCGLCGSDEAFTGTCGGGRRDPRALCYEPVAQQPQAEAVPPGVVSDAMVEAACDAVAAALGDAYDCGRVWSAWRYGGMGPDDFFQVSEDCDRVREIAVAAIDAAIAAQGEKP